MPNPKQTEEPTQYTLDQLKESEADEKAGRVTSFNNPKDALAYVKSLSSDTPEQECTCPEEFKKRFKSFHHKGCVVRKEVNKMAEDTKQKINNVCFHKCHELGQSRCSKCATFHISKEPTATHENDKSNPSF